MQDRYRRIDKILLRRTAGPYIRVIRDRATQRQGLPMSAMHPIATRILQRRDWSLSAISDHNAPQQTTVVRGRDASYLAPPAQIRTCGFPAYGSHLGCVTANFPYALQRL